MSPRIESVVVPAHGGRDDGKTFRISEMDAARAEKWAWRLVIALKGTSAEIPPEVAQMGMVGIAIRGINAFLAADIRFADVEPLLDEMFDCIAIVRDARHPEVAPAIVPNDIQEVTTRAWLRSEVLRVHTGFSFADSLSTLMSQLRAASAGLQSI
jgi:hypothetical protein